MCQQGSLVCLGWAHRGYGCGRDSGRWHAHRLTGILLQMYYTSALPSYGVVNDNGL